MSILFNNRSFTLKMFVMNEKRILNFFEKQIENDNLNVSATPEY